MLRGNIIFAKHSYGKGLMSKIHKQLKIQMFEKKHFSWGKDVKPHLRRHTNGTQIYKIAHILRELNTNVRMRTRLLGR